MTWSSQPDIEFINRSLSEICFSADHNHYHTWDNPRRFSGYAERLQLLLNQLLRSFSPENLPPSLQTSLKGIAGDLAKIVELLSVYEKKSKIYVLIKCQELCASLQESTLAIGGWLALLDSVLNGAPDLRKKVSDLSADMKQAQFRVTEKEERVRCTLEKEGEGRQTSKTIQSAILMDLARALGIDPNNHAELFEHVKHLKNDLANSDSVLDKRILVSLEGIVSNWPTEPGIMTRNPEHNLEEDAHILPFKNFICPLTKEVMKDPVVLVSSQTYERIAIKQWFQQCLEDGREPTCPVSGQALNSLELKPNIGLAGAIEEWVNRNIEFHVKSALNCLSEDHPSEECVEAVLDNIYKISEEHPSSRYIVRSAGIVVLIIKILKTGSKTFGSHLRSKCLLALLSMTKDEESKDRMFEEGITRLAIHGLIGSSEKEREYAVKLLLEFSRNEAYSVKIAAEKGALVLLASMAENLEHPALCKLAEEVLQLMERAEGNVQRLATAGRFEPLLNRLCEGADDSKVEMASIIGRMTLTSSSKRRIANRSAKILVDLLYKQEGRAPSLQALYNLSSLDDNATVLIDSAILPALTEILFANQGTSVELKESAASIIANILSSPGNWELASADRESHLMQSETILLGLLDLLSIASPPCQASILKILYRIASSPQASELVTSQIRSGDGLKTIVAFLEHPEVENRLHAFRLTRLLSERVSDDLSKELKISDKVSLLKDKLLDGQSEDGERSDAACILSNITFSENEVNVVLEPSFVKWTVSALTDQLEKTIRPTTSLMVEGLLGILLQVARNHDHQSLSIIKENSLMTVFHNQLVTTSNARVKQRAALGLKYLSEHGSTFAWSNSDQPPPRRFPSFLVFMCCRGSSPPRYSCPIHGSPCEEDSQFCLLKSNCIKQLTYLLKDEDTCVQIAALEALSTLVSNNSNDFKQVVEELETIGVVEAVFELFTTARSGVVQEKAIWMVERLLRAESIVQKHSLDQALFKALVEAFKSRNSISKRHAQECLTHLKQISGVSGKPLSQNGRRSR